MLYITFVSFIVIIKSLAFIQFHRLVLPQSPTKYNPFHPLQATEGIDHTVFILSAVKIDANVFALYFSSSHSVSSVNLQTFNTVSTPLIITAKT